MRAITVTRLDGPSAVEVQDIPEPSRDPTDVLIDVRTAGLCFPDVLLTHGSYQLKPELPFVLGGELAGVVREAPQDSGFEPGDRVVAVTRIGSFQEVVAIPADRVFPLPDETTFAAGACIPVNYFTTHFALERGRLAPGDTVVIHGAAGGVGTSATQLATAGGAQVIAVVSSDAKADIAKAAGAHHTIPVDGFKDAVMELTEGRGADIVVDPVGGDRFTDSLRCLAPLGRVLVIGFAGGSIPEVKVNRLLLNNTEIIGVSSGTYARSKPGQYARMWNDLVPLMRSGVVDPPIEATFPLDQAAEALAKLDNREVIGKVILEV